MTEEKPTDKFMSDMLPVNKRQPLDDAAGPDAGAASDDDADGVAVNQNGKNVAMKSIRSLMHWTHPRQHYRALALE